MKLERWTIIVVSVVVTFLFFWALGVYFFGGWMKPLSEHAKEELANLSREPIPCSGVNPGVVRRLLDGELAEVVQLPSPFPSHRGRNCNHLQITEAGRREHGRNLLAIGLAKAKQQVTEAKIKARIA